MLLSPIFNPLLLIEFQLLFLRLLSLFFSFLLWLLLLFFLLILFLNQIVVELLLGELEFTTKELLSLRLLLQLALSDFVEDLQLLSPLLYFADSQLTQRL